MRDILSSIFKGDFLIVYLAGRECFLFFCGLLEDLRVLFLWCFFYPIKHARLSVLMLNVILCVSSWSSFLGIFSWFGSSCFFLSFLPFMTITFWNILLCPTSCKIYSGAVYSKLYIKHIVDGMRMIKIIERVN